MDTVKAQAWLCLAWPKPLEVPLTSCIVMRSRHNRIEVIFSDQNNMEGAARHYQLVAMRGGTAAQRWFGSGVQYMWKWIEGSGWQNFLLALVNNGDQCYQQTMTGYVLIMHCTFKLQSSKVCTKASKRSEIAGGTNTTRTERGRLFSDAFHSNKLSWRLIHLLVAACSGKLMTRSKELVCYNTYGAGYLVYIVLLPWRHHWVQYSRLVKRWMWWVVQFIWYLIYNIDIL